MVQFAILSHIFDHKKYVKITKMICLTMFYPNFFPDFFKFQAVSYLIMSDGMAASTDLTKPHHTMTL